MSKRRQADWRDRAASDLLLKNLPGVHPSGEGLVMLVSDPTLVQVMRDRGMEVESWNRRGSGERPGLPWPPSGPFDFVSLRLPRAKEELGMALHAAASVLRPGGTISVFGANDEGIQSAGTSLGDLFSEIETVAVGGRCRVLKGRWEGDAVDLRATLEDWRMELDLGHPELPSPWYSYPGVFAHGRLDPGTRLLLDVLPELPSGARVLDYGCGSGPVGSVALRRGRGVRVDLLDLDSVALLAAKENVPEGRPLLRDGLPSPGKETYGAILSNPPFHRGKAEEPGMIEEFIERVPALLHREGVLVFVAQKRLPVEHQLRARFRQVAILGEDRTYRVWQAAGPRGLGARPGWTEEGGGDYPPPGRSRQSAKTENFVELEHGGPPPLNSRGASR